jgi:hypothetical protein
MLYIYNRTMLGICVKIHPYLVVIHITITKWKKHDVCGQLNKYTFSQAAENSEHSHNQLYHSTITVAEL